MKAAVIVGILPGLLLYLVLAFASGAIMAKKGLSRTLGFFFGLLLGPLGLLLAVLLPPPRETPARARRKREWFG